MAVIYGTNYHDNNTYQGTPHTGGAFYRALSGTNYNDSLFGYAGQDILYGLGGNDTLIGGLGNDQLHGGHGNDVLISNDGQPANDYDTDRMYGGMGDDARAEVHVGDVGALLRSALRALSKA